MNSNLSSIFDKDLFNDLYMSSEDEDSDDAALWVPEKIKKARSRHRTYCSQDRKESVFWKKYVLPGFDDDSSIHDETSSLGKKFRRRFRVPYCIFLEIVRSLKEENGLADFKVEASGEEGVHIRLLVLGSLRALGSGCTFDLIEELTSVSEESHRVFFQKEFLKWGERIAPRFIKMPDNQEEVRHIMALYERLGLPGCAGSIDCVHLVWDRCPAKWSNLCKGKDKVTTIVFEVVASHTKKVMAVSSWYYGTWNDKSIARLDPVFKLFNRNGNNFLGNIKWKVVTDRTLMSRLEFTGAYMICDGGYHNWACLVCPYKHQIPGTDIEKWSKNVESVRKDVECVFGILKKRFLFLKHPVRLHNADTIHKAFVTCCVIHNILVDHDGRDNWNDSGEDITEEYNALERLAAMRASRSRMRNGVSGVRSNRRDEYGVNDNPSVDDYDGYNVKEKHEFDKRRAALIKHFNSLSATRTLRINH